MNATWSADQAADGSTGSKQVDRGRTVRRLNRQPPGKGSIVATIQAGGECWKTPGTTSRSARRFVGGRCGSASKKIFLKKNRIDLVKILQEEHVAHEAEIPY